MARGIFEYELTDDGNWTHSARAIQKAREAFLAGDREPLLELLHDHGDLLAIPVTLSLHLSQLITDILTGKTKRPNRRPKKIHLSQNDIISLGHRVEYFRREEIDLSMTRAGAIEAVAEGLLAIEDLGWEKIPAIPKTQVKKAYALFQQLEREKQLTADRRSRKKSPRSTK